MLIKVLLVVLGVLALAKAVPVEGPRVVELPEGDGEINKIDLDEQPDLELLSEITKNPAHNQYLLYTRRNPTEPQELVVNDASTLWSSGFEAWKTTVVIVHGWLGNQNSDLNPVIRDAILKRSDVNVIVLDWRRLANSGYVTAATGAPAIGRGLGQFLEFLHHNTGLNYRQVHIVGFSLGAHIAGNAGRFLRGQVGRITGLDPAGPLWNLNSNRLSSADAVYVEGIHTNGGTAGLGLGSAIGNVDFFPNGGNSQPGCLTPMCDHNRAWELFAASVTHDHLVGNECDSNLQLTLNRCRGRKLRLGNDDVYKTGSGIYRINTARRYPF